MDEDAGPEEHKHARNHDRPLVVRPVLYGRGEPPEEQQDAQVRRVRERGGRPEGVQGDGHPAVLLQQGGVCAEAEGGGVEGVF